MAWCFSTRASVATVLTTHPCVSRCLRVNTVFCGFFIIITMYFFCPDNNMNNLAKLTWAVLRLYGQGDQWQYNTPEGREHFSEVHTFGHSLLRLRYTHLDTHYFVWGTHIWTLITSSYISHISTPHGLMRCLYSQTGISAQSCLCQNNVVWHTSDKSIQGHIDNPNQLVVIIDKT